MPLMALGPQPQGRSSKVAEEPFEIIDPPALYTEEVLRRFPSLMTRQADYTVWWERHKSLLISVRDRLDALTRKVNST